jgi:dUTP pyrophosphatase
MNFNNGIPFKHFLSNYFSFTQHDRIMHLSIYIDDLDGELKNKYVNAALNHNSKLFRDPHFYDAGFDLFLPKDDTFVGTRFFGNDGENSCNKINKINFKVKCCARMFTKTEDSNLYENHFYYTPFYTYARSSLSKTPLRLANNQGIIDAGYRGPLIGMFDCIYSEVNTGRISYDYYLDEYTRLLQICAPGLVPIYVEIVNSHSDLGPNTSRGEGGFGSTGI